MNEKVISLDEAKTALRCMRLGGLDENEALECIDEVVERVRTVTLSKLVENIINEKLSDVQRDFIKKYWYEQKSTLQIARESGVSQATVYKTIERANGVIKELMTPVIRYAENSAEADIITVTQQALETCAAEKRISQSFCEELRNVRVKNAIEPKTLARALKISLKELEEIECGHRVPSVVTMMRYSAIFEMKIKITFVNGRGVYEWERA